MSWTNAVITDAGHRLQAALLGTGKGLVFTRAVTGAGLAEGELAAQTAVTEERQTLSLQPATPLEDAKTKVQVLLSNAGLEAGYTMHQLGFYAKAQDEEDEILYALVQDETGDTIPADAESPGFTSDWSYVFAYGNADSVTVMVDPAGMITWDKVGAAGGVAPLGPDGKVPEEHLPETGAFTNDEILDAETATDIGLGHGAVPADMFNVLAHIGDLHVWRRTVTVKDSIPARYELESKKTNAIVSDLKRLDFGIEARYSDSVSVNDSGSVSLSGEVKYKYFKTNEFSSANTIAELEGKYCSFSQNGGVPQDGTVTSGIFYIKDSEFYLTPETPRQFQCTCQKVIGIAKVPAGTTIDYPVSTNRNAYQEGSDAKPAGFIKGEVETGRFLMIKDFRPSGVNVEVQYKIGSNVNVSEEGVASVQLEQYVSADQASDNLTQLNPIKGKYIEYDTLIGGADGDFRKGDVYFIPSDAEIKSDTSYNSPYVTKRQKVSGYPAISAGTTIEYLGNLGDKSRIISGSYIGAGTGVALIPSAEGAKAIIIDGDHSKTEFSFIYVSNPTTQAMGIRFTGNNAVRSGVTISWGSDIRITSDDSNQYFSKLGKQYFYKIIV